MQKKQIIQFAALLVSILALAGVYAGIRSYNNRQEEEKKQQEEQAKATLTAFGPDSVTAVSYRAGAADLTFEKEGEDWKEIHNSDITLDQDAFSEFLEEAGSITAEEEVQVQEGEDYGFSDSIRTVSITTVKGECSLIFGMKNEMLDQYYIKTSESDKVYLVEGSVYTIFDKTVEDFEKAGTDTDTDEKEDTQAE